MLHFSKIQIKLVNQILRNKEKIKVRYTGWNWRPQNRTQCCGFRSRLIMPKLQVITYNKFKTFVKKD